jgi:NAD(P)-dependent dehydrogenase (short-subunit alcohol dehydrogenase family)
VDCGDPNFERRPYEPWVAYGQSKTANILFALQLAELGQAEGVQAFSLHPGRIVATSLIRHLSPEQLRSSGALDEDGRPIADLGRGTKTIAQGAATIVWCATSEQLDGRNWDYCEDCDIASIADEGAPEFAGVKKWAIDPGKAERLWRFSGRLTGVTFGG